MSSNRWFLILEDYDEYLRDPVKYTETHRRDAPLTKQEKAKRLKKRKAYFFKSVRASQETFFRKHVVVKENPFLSFDELFEIYIQAKWKASMGGSQNKSHLWCFAFKAFKEAEERQLTKGQAVELAVDYISTMSKNPDDSVSIPTITEWIEPLIKWRSIKLQKKGY